MVGTLIIIVSIVVGLTAYYISKKDDEGCEDDYESGINYEMVFPGDDNEYGKTE